MAAGFEPWFGMGLSSAAGVHTIQTHGASRKMLARQPATEAPAQDTTGSGLYVFNVPECWSADDLRVLFAPFGSLQRCWVARDDNGKMEGFGFLRYASRQEACKAMNYTQGNLVKGRHLEVYFGEEAFYHKQPSSSQPSQPQQQPIMRPPSSLAELIKSGRVAGMSRADLWVESVMFVEKAWIDENRPIPLATSPDTDEFYQQSMLIFERLVDIQQQQQQQQTGADSQSNVSTTDMPTIDSSGSYSHFGASQYAPSWPSMAQMIASSKTEESNTAGDDKGEADKEGEGVRESQDSQEELAEGCVDVGTRKYGLDIMLAIRRKNLSSASLTEPVPELAGLRLVHPYRPTATKTPTKSNKRRTQNSTSSTSTGSGSGSGAGNMRNRRGMRLQGADALVEAIARAMRVAAR
ncbi:unnamed protein product [Vitrella brassicaformis CCMP3155]|uniref:RRM domain-containing protein n=2 Tax=Vitrella brassicaformis TaxID=1169539 RepID=A0A0G4FK40_VITBC|nr:unnamed protein product [Vitrella brassicaformis CCMP3155]|eukprot:CEM13752.1 unnamed protein product [Vitrella brassicaformis CCMP3155]